LRGNGMLTKERIRAVVSDASILLKTHGKKLDALRNANADGDTLEKARKEGVDSFASIVPHHCGNHQQCNETSCRMLKIRKEVKESNPELSTFEFNEIVEQKHADGARFCAAVMDIGTSGQNRLSKKITSKISDSNIDSLAAQKSSLPCEHFFSVLTKWTEGKRRHLGHGNQLQGVVGLAAAQLSNPNIQDVLLADLTMQSNQTRETATARLKAQKASRSKSKKKEKNIQRRRVSKRLLNVQMGRDSQSTKRHIAGKVDPTEKCQTTVEDAEVILADNSGDEIAAQKRKVSKKRKKKSSSSPRKLKCSNCGAVGHSKKSCHEPKHALESEAKKRKRDDLSQHWGDLVH
jgi:hypothetical protein